MWEPLQKIITQPIFLIVARMTSRLKILPKYKVLPPHPLKVGRDLVLKDLYDIKEAIS